MQTLHIYMVKPNSRFHFIRDREDDAHFVYGWQHTMPATAPNYCISPSVPNANACENVQQNTKVDNDELEHQPKKMCVLLIKHRPWSCTANGYRHYLPHRQFGTSHIYMAYENSAFRTLEALFLAER